MNHACPHCGTTTTRPGRCLACSRPENQRKNARPTASVYQSKRWRQLRAIQLQRYPWCQCMQPATTVDHMRPFTSSSDPLAWDPTNLRSMCARCHGHKDGARAQVLRARPASHAA